MHKDSVAASTQHQTWDELRRQIAGSVWPALIILAVLLQFGTEAWRWPWQMQVLSLFLVLLAFSVRALLGRWYHLAVFLLAIGCLAADLLTLIWFPSVPTLSLLAIPSGLAALLLGAIPGLAVAGLASVLSLWAPSFSPAAISSQVVPALIAMWVTVGLVLSSTHFGGQAIESLWTSYARMEQLLREARDQRLELRQVQSDLVDANRELALLSDRLAAMHRIAEDARRAKEEFVANVSHELRTPLNMIIGFSEMITNAPDTYQLEVPPALIADVGVILRNSRHLASLVDDVLDLSTMEAGQLALSKEWVSLPEVVEEAIVAVQPLYGAKRLSLDLEATGDLPPVFCDRTRIRQVLLNLLSNAGRYTERGGAKVRLKTVGSSLIASVADTGPGIAPEHHERIFAPFQQVDASPRRRYGGKGLGLTISRRFIELHGGRMWLESEPGKGSIFYFSLPLHEDLPVAGADPRRWLSAYHQENPRTRRSMAPRPSGEPRYVVLEEGSALRRLLGRRLEGAELVPVRRFEQALQQLDKAPARALLINDATAVQAASGLLPQAADLPLDTPAIACWVPGEEQAAARLGVVRYLVKPVSREALCAAVDNLGDGMRTILLVDDDEQVLQLFGRMLASTSRGYRLLRASNGKRALRLLRERKPDAMLLDLVMPGMDGYAVLREKAQDPEIQGIPVLAITALDPAREPLAGNSLILVRSRGLEFRDLLVCLESWGDTTPVPHRSPGSEPPGGPGG